MQRIRDQSRTKSHVAPFCRCPGTQPSAGFQYAAQFLRCAAWILNVLECGATENQIHRLIGQRNPAISPDDDGLVNCRVFQDGRINIHSDQPAALSLEYPEFSAKGQLRIGNKTPSGPKVHDGHFGVQE